MKYQNLEQYRTPPGFRGKSKITVQLWWIVQATLFRGSPQFAYGWRRFLLRSFGAHIGKKVLLRPTVKTTYPWKLSIGNHSWIGDHVHLYTLGPIEIGTNAVISQKCYLCTGTHDYTSADFAITAQKISIGDKCWLATDVFVAPGVTIAPGAVVGARSSVYTDMPENQVCIGNPAKPVKSRA